MRFVHLALPGAYLIEPELIPDERGAFGRVFCQAEFAACGLEHEFVQCNVSRNLRPGTLRGLHYQAAPDEEAKLIRCTHGSLYAVVLDMRQDRPTFGQWCAVDLTSRKDTMLYVPVGCANGFQTLEAGTEVHYQMSTPYRPDSARRVRWNDPQFAIDWPAADVRILSRADAECPDFDSRTVTR